MVLVGISWLFYWLLVDTFDVESLKAALITGIVFVVVGLVLDNKDRLTVKR